MQGNIIDHTVAAVSSRRVLKAEAALTPMTLLTILVV